VLAALGSVEYGAYSVGRILLMDTPRRLFSIVPQNLGKGQTLKIVA
jgi:hypothetical protein